MKRVRPRALVHRGTIEAAALLFEADAGERLLACWVPGAAVERFDRYHLLRLPRPARVRAEAAPGLPLVRRDGCLVSAPLDDAEWAAVDPAPDAVVLVRGGVVVEWGADERAAVDPAAWLDVGDLAAVAVEPLGDPPAGIATPLAAAAVEALFAAHVGAAAPERDDVARALQRGEAPDPTPRSAAAQAARGLGALAARGALALLDRLRGRRGQGSAAPAPGAAVLPIPATPRRGLLDRLRDALLRASLNAGLGRLLGRRYARYLARMVSLFQRGDLDEALRHAIPLAGDDEPAAGRPALRLPTRREQLEIRPARTFGGGGLSVVPEWMSMLRGIYRRAFDQLVAQRRDEEAAYVLAELLGADEEAVAFLESRGKLRLAAELAEARDLAPGLVVRQWWLAGERERAALVARRTGAFQDAVSRLERAGDAAAAPLRERWAETLAAAGDYAGAVDALWPAEALRAGAARWIDRGIAAGGPQGGLLLARKAALQPGPEVAAQVEALLADGTLDRLPARVAFARELQRNRSPAQPAAGLAVAAWRSLVRDAPADAQVRLVAPGLLTLASGTPLAADAPSLQAVPVAPAWSPADPPRRLAAGETGTFRVEDAAELPDGHTLLALGEAGVRVVTRDGREVVHFDQPAHRLVLADHGHHALAIARRGESWRLARIDLVQRRARPWADARFDRFASTFDGQCWFVAHGGEVLGVDAQAGRFAALWRVDGLGGDVQSLARTPDQLQLLVTDGDGFTLWGYDLPGCVLRRRGPFGQSGPTLRPLPLEGDALVGLLEADLQTRRVACRLADGPWGRLVTLGPDLPAGGQRLRLAHQFVAVTGQRAGGMEVHLHDVEGRLRATFELAGAKAATTRFTETSLLIADDRGRVLTFDLTRGEIRRRLRV